MDISQKDIEEFIANSKAESTFSRKPPPDWLLEEYYSAWKQGKDAEGIFQKCYDICFIKRSLFESYMPHFYAFVRKKNSEAMKNSVCVMTRTEELENSLVLAISCGATKESAARMYNIPLPTLQIWMEDDPIFRNAMLHAQERSNMAVQQALFKRATGFKHVLRSKTITRQLTKDPEAADTVDGYLIMENASEREELIEPSVEAIKFWLSNRDSKQFSLTGGIVDTAQKGKILEAVEEMTAMTPEDEAELNAGNEPEDEA